MSTKATIAYADLPDGTGFHLFRELFEDGAVYLQLEGVSFDAQFYGEPFKPQVTVRLPDDLARRLRVLPLEENADG